MIKLIRFTTVPISLKVLLQGQLKVMSEYLNVIAISSLGATLNELGENERIQTIPLKMTRKITPIRDGFALLRLLIILKTNLFNSHNCEKKPIYSC